MMRRFLARTLILPNGERCSNFIVDVEGCSACYYPFENEIHSTVYIEVPILLNPRADLEGKKVDVNQLDWLLVKEKLAADVPLYAYRLDKCAVCNNLLTATKL